MLRFGTILLVWIAVGAFEFALGSKFYSSSISGKPCLPGQPCPYGKPFYPSKSKPHRPALPAKYSYKKSTSKNSCISSFSCTFTEKVRASPVLTEMFNCFKQTPGEEFCIGIYPDILEAVTDIGAANPEFVAEQAVESIAESFDFLSPETVILAHANSAGKYLYTQGALTQQNSVELATQYADMMEEAAKCNDSEYTTLRDGFVAFIKSFGLYRADTVLLIALQYANEWKMLAKPKCG